MSVKNENSVVNDNFSLEARAEASRSAHALDELLQQYRELSDSERLKGNFFEELVRSYLRYDAQMRGQFARVYLWRDWPGAQGRPDTGIDLVAVAPEDMPRDGSEPNGLTPAVAIQCKFFAPGTRIAREHLNSFLAASGKSPFKRRIFVDTTGAQWSSNAEDVIYGQQIPVSRIGLTDLRNSNIDWSTYQLIKPEEAPAQQSRKELRPHQAAAIGNVVAGLDTAARGTLVMACGTGKTFTSLKLAERLAEANGGGLRMMFMVPSLALMSQTLQEWAAECELPFAAWSVCSDTKVNRKKANQSDLADIASVDLKTPPTTDPQRLADSLTAHVGGEGLEVVFATYQSIDIVHQAQQLAGESWQDFDLIICDEAHRTTGVKLAGEDETAFTRVHSNDYIRAAKRLYMTATPRLFAPNVKNIAKEKDAVLTSMDDENIYGRVLHRLGFGEAVSQGLLTDYKVVVLAVPEDEMTVKIQQAAGVELPLPDVAKLVGCWNALAKRKNGGADSQYGDDLQPMRRAVAFAKSIAVSKQITEEFPQLVARELCDLDNDDQSDNLLVECQHVDGGMNAIERGQALDWLKAGSAGKEQVCRILTNARCLSEGVDVPTLDAVLFLNPRRSQVDVIQAVGRVMRKAEGKSYGYIVLPVAVPAGVSPEMALDDNKRFEVVWQVLQAIRAHDERFDATVNAIEYNSGRPENIVVDVVSFAKPEKPTVFGDEGGDNGGYDGDGGRDGVSGSSDSGSSDGGSGDGGSGDGGSGDAGGSFGGDGTGGGNGSGGGDDEGGAIVCPMPPTHPQLPIFPAAEWKDAVYSKLVKKVGNRLYWDDWSKEIADIAHSHMKLIEHLLEDPQNHDAFVGFVKSLQQTLNPAVTAADATEMLAQHLITKPLFDAMFPDQAFTAKNPVSGAMEKILARLATNEQFEREREPLKKFYDTVTAKISAIDNLAGKQDIMRTLYDNFFTKAFARMQDRLGIVFTPVEVVDYILRSADDALQTHLGRSLSDRGVAVIEPFLGTGTFVTRLLQSGLIRKEDLEHKYRNEIFANEIVLLSYYIASINIEQVYHELRKEQGFVEEYQEFTGISLTDTFQIEEGNDGAVEALGELELNRERMERQRLAPIQVVIMNPPYSAGQKSANDNNQNLKYPALDRQIAETYASLSEATNKNSLYDSYYRALRWASNRIGQEGVIAFVANSGFIDSTTAQGVRRAWQREFSDIYVYNLRGGVRGKLGEAAKQEGGNVFPIMTGVAIAVLVRKRGHEGEARIHYAEVADYLTTYEKLTQLKREGSLAGSEFVEVPPNAHGDWINQRDEKYLSYQILGDKTDKGKETTPGIFRQFSRGLSTSRDAWCYSFGAAAVSANMQRMIANYNAAVAAGKTATTVETDKQQVSWNVQLFQDLDRGKKHAFVPEAVVPAVYRPFCKQSAYFASEMNDRTYQLPRLFPTPEHPNLVINIPAGGSAEYFMPVMYSLIPALTPNGGNQVFALYTWEQETAAATNNHGFDFDQLLAATDTGPASFSGSFDFKHPIGSQVPAEIAGYKRKDNITDATLNTYRAHYRDEVSPSGEQLSKEDIFFYVYALLHHPEYREKYAADLKKMLPRIPKVKDFWSYSLIGRELAELHVNYETVEPHPAVNTQWAEAAPSDPHQKYRVTKLTWGKGKTAKEKDRTSLVYNEYLTFTGIPESEGEYQIAGRSPLAWVIDRYQVTTHKESGIVNDPNTYCAEIGNPAYIAQLIPKLVTVSLRTQELLAALPELQITE